MLPKNLGFVRLPELDQVAMFKAKLASFLPNMAKVTSSQTRMFPGFSGNMAISLSQAAQCLGTQVTNAALGRRGLRRASSFYARAWVGWR